MIMQVIEIIVMVLAVLILDDDDAVRGLQPSQHALQGADHGC
jgi:hypothetical protein